MLNRQTRDARIPDHRGSGQGSSISRSASIDAPRLGSPFQSGSDMASQTYFSARNNSSTVNLTGGDDVSESSGSESISSMFLKRSSSAKRKPMDSPVQSFADLTNDLRSHSNANVGRSATGTPQGPRFVGTPDYLAPEIILGYGGEDKVLDWVRQDHLLCNHLTNSIGSCSGLWASYHMSSCTEFLHSMRTLLNRYLRISSPGGSTGMRTGSTSRLKLVTSWNVSCVSIPLSDLAIMARRKSSSILSWLMSTGTM